MLINSLGFPNEFVSTTTSQTTSQPTNQPTNQRVHWMNETSVYVVQYGTFFTLFNELGIDAMRCVYNDFELHILIYAIRIYIDFTFSHFHNRLVKHV